MSQETTLGAQSGGTLVERIHTVADAVSTTSLMHLTHHLPLNLEKVISLLRPSPFQDVASYSTRRGPGLPTVQENLVLSRVLLQVKHSNLDECGFDGNILRGHTNPFGTRAA
jgi:hypothetical protein